MWDVEHLRIQCERIVRWMPRQGVHRGQRIYRSCLSRFRGVDGVDVMAYDPVECRFKEGEDFKRFNLKWVDHDDISWHHVEDKNLSDRLKRLAVDVFKATSGRGYGRVDVRSDPTGENLYYLEMNPNCGIFYPEGLYGCADFILDQEDSKTAHAAFALAQVEVAKRLWQQNKPIFEARYDAKAESWGLFALRELGVGEIIQHNEEAGLHVVTKSHVLRNWNTKSKENFNTYCWPISNNLFAMWNPEPDEWLPINHSCDPNAWNEVGNGLNLVARRCIVVGEEIQMDYATFVGFFPEMTSFKCNGGTGACRGTITGMDIVNIPELSQRYHGHMTEYISMRAREVHGNDLNSSLGQFASMT